MNRRLVHVALFVSAIVPSCSRPRVAPVAVAAPATDPSPPPHPQPATPFAAWLHARLPAGGTIVAADSGKLAVEHTVAVGDTALTVAKAYLDLTDVYRVKDLAAELSKRNPEFRTGSQIEIPHLLSEPYPSPDDGRMPWPADRALKGVFISGVFAGQFWPETIDKVATHGMNAIVLDAKDYMGPVSYPTKVRLALEIGAANDPPIADFARAIRFAHARGILIIARIPCFHDPWAAKHAPRLSLMNKSGRPFQMGWTDPSNVEVQDYVVDLVREAVELGADEVQLDYVRFPVQAHGIANAAMPAPDGHRSQAMKAFVHRVHEVTQAKHVPLSLDLFGVTATGELSDIEALGQNLSVLASEAEAVSPMVYPSHYAPGWNGFAEPGAHPEIIGIGAKAALEKLRAGRVKGAIVRPWLQASSYKTPNYGPQYVLDEIKSAESSGAVGWLFWDPANSYWPVWKGLPRVDRAAAR
ncbi:MAG TPA: putative glycoside hydrolase [Polyangiaceae bacterium]|nr:putative glycoside hydrolase [Polyangiaceae bacterium]